MKKYSALSAIVALALATLVPAQAQAAAHYPMHTIGCARVGYAIQVPRAWTLHGSCTTHTTVQGGNPAIWMVINSESMAAWPLSVAKPFQLNEYSRINQVDDSMTLIASPAKMVTHGYASIGSMAMYTFTNGQTAYAFIFQICRHGLLHTLEIGVDVTGGTQSSNDAAVTIKDMFATLVVR